jgi:hypothetical protein
MLDLPGYDEGISKRLAGSLNVSDKIEPPFKAVYLWALNGQAMFKKDNNAMFYGGWACKAEDLQAVADETGSPIPASWTLTDVPTRNGDAFPGYVTRTLYVAPFAMREAWLKDGLHSPDYSDGARRHVQWLAWLGMKKAVGNKEGQGDWKIESWGPVVLTAKGYQARSIKAAFDAWAKATAPVRGSYAWNQFYATVGTFGKERVATMAGKQGAQSPVTLLSLWNVDEGQMTSELLKRLYVGGEVSAMMVSYFDEAEKWRNAWKHEEENGEGAADNGADAGPNFDEPF